VDLVRVHVDDLQMMLGRERIRRIITARPADANSRIGEVAAETLADVSFADEKDRDMAVIRVCALLHAARVVTRGVAAKTQPVSSSAVRLGSERPGVRGHRKSKRGRGK
jgi:hypothetical protein